MDIKTLKQTTGLSGSIVIPADKSISHRAVMFSSLANGVTKISNFLTSADCLTTMNIFKQLGVDISLSSGNEVIVKSFGKLQKTDKNLDCGNSGTTMRLLSGILSGQDFDSVLFGDESLSKRPMRRIVEPLSLMGANISSNSFKSPLTIKGQHLHGIEYNSPIASAQVKSSILLAGLNASGETIVHEPYLSRNHTELMLKAMGANIETYNSSTKIKKSELSSCREIIIPGDISSAAFFIVAALIIPDSDIVIKNVGLNPTRSGIIDIVKRMGGNIEILDESISSGEKIGDIRVKYSELKSCTICGEDIPRLIDELPVIALLATQAEGTTIIKDAQDLRNKETDRISAITKEFRKIGIEIDELDDGFKIYGKQTIQGDVSLDVYKDHRIAMTLYIAGMISEKENLIKNFEWVNISMPQFMQLMNSLC